jgi:hypothetical protein
MGPKVIGFEGPVSDGRLDGDMKQIAWDPDNVSLDVLMQYKLSTEQQHLIALENGRKLHVRKVLDAFESNKVKVRLFQALLHARSQPASTDMPQDDEDSPTEDKYSSTEDEDFSTEDENSMPDPFNSPRFDEVRNYLLNNRRELALDSLYFTIPEHLLYSYIMTNGGLKLEPEEWRDFLISCNSKKWYFRYVTCASNISLY